MADGFGVCRAERRGVDGFVSATARYQHCRGVGVVAVQLAVALRWSSRSRREQEHMIRGVCLIWVFSNYEHVLESAAERGEGVSLSSVFKLRRQFEVEYSHAGQHIGRSPPRPPERLALPWFSWPMSPPINQQLGRERSATTSLYSIDPPFIIIAARSASKSILRLSLSARLGKCWSSRKLGGEYPRSCYCVLALPSSFGRWDLDPGAEDRVGVR